MVPLDEPFLWQYLIYYLMISKHIILDGFTKICGTISQIPIPYSQVRLLNYPHRRIIFSKTV